MLRPYRTLNVKPFLPPRLQPLQEMAYNLWWSWNQEAVELFRRIDPELFEAVHHNPVQLLGRVSQSRLDDLTQDEGFLSQMDRVYEAFREYMQGAPPLRQGEAKYVIAYFSMEYGLSEALPIYSGGLGILSGDHLKTASDMAFPLVGVGMLYQEGYFRQYLNADGWQQETYPLNDFYNMPVQLERDASGAPVIVSVEYPGREVHAQIWRIQVGRVPLFMLDTNIESNRPEDRAITSKLYAGDRDMRIRQEILLGIGGLRALKALGIVPTVCHMNEGHSAFLALERIRESIKRYGLSFDEARVLAMAGNVFTTHTPVPAGIDLFDPQMVEYYFGQWMQELGLSRDQFLALGRAPGASSQEPFSMAILALHLSDYANGVSQLHRRVAQEMWCNLWPEIPSQEVPIDAVTNGVHVSTWVSSAMGELYTEYLGPRWRTEPADPEIWQRVERIPDEELWQIHERRRERLVQLARRQAVAQLERRGASQREIAEASCMLDPNALTIGFARRFATYKRALLLFRDPDRLARILNQPGRPVQILFAGKAHPEDFPAKELIRQLVHFCRRPDMRCRILFLEDYDIALAQALVQGVDVWLNTPRRGQEASGTSGMKACMNGVLHVSTLDGWWDEGYSPAIGWRIGNGEAYADDSYGDEVEAHALYDLLEKDIVPLFYERNANGVPHGWVAMMKRSIASVGARFNTHRMLQEYIQKFYQPSIERYTRLEAENAQAARALSRWLARIKAAWPQIRIVEIHSSAQDGVTVHDTVRFEALLDLGALSPEDVLVQVCLGTTGPGGTLVDYDVVPMTCNGRQENGLYRFGVSTSFEETGLSGYTVRVFPYHPDLVTPYVPGLVLWAG